MFPKWVIPLLIFAVPMVGCEKSSPKPSASSAKAKSSATASSKAKGSASATVGAKAPPKASSAPPETSTSALALKTSSAPSAKPPPAPPPVPVVEKIHVPDPVGVDFIYLRDWIPKEQPRPDYDLLNRQGKNEPITYLVIMHTALPTPSTVDNEMAQVSSIRNGHMAPKPRGRGWAEIAYHYIILPSGRVLQGVPIWYSYPGPLIGSGMGNNKQPANKCSIAILGDLNSPDQEFTEAAQVALATMVDDRKRNFNHLYREALQDQYNQLKIALGPNGNPEGTDKVRVKINPTITAGPNRKIIQDILDGEPVKRRRKKPRLNLGKK